MAKLPIINVGNTDENADWIKTPENRESERRIHEELEAEFKRKEKDKEAKGDKVAP